MDQLSFTEVGDVLGLIRQLDCDTFELECGDFRISVCRAGTADPPVASGPAAAPEPTEPARPVEPAEQPGEPDAAVAVSSPMTGTFYRSPAPGEPPCASVGEQVAKGQTVALIEVMKLFTELKAEVAGTVVRIDAEDGCLVEYGQPLIWIEPR
ncbi:acetyl-CoA carboxylase biotin carboxyl carrier protein [Amycolatopsis alkalitolerans]|uniref:Biotin carboxyl carrier protein of acetyl-CoA carboxylase n=1 Tax=Amycolatopsis alkalitolerans TaxID=2547244 RepID=A0A5C4M368_9PSEU|nr:biotin/lipoyl-containing protein [Amycolatopsis alkalitolerans]TNC25763.1 acetyl-CoA carboxylase, biotin carboxyl carrier protein [Amycolatopsis alkalitolerans]